MLTICPWFNVWRGDLAIQLEDHFIIFFFICAVLKITNFYNYYYCHSFYSINFCICFLVSLNLMIFLLESCSGPMT